MLSHRVIVAPEARAAGTRGEDAIERALAEASHTAMSSWRGGLGLGAVALGAAIASGSRPLGVVGLGFLLAGAATWLWTWLAERPSPLSLDVRPESATEGDRVDSSRS